MHVLVYWEYTIISACIGKILDVIFVLDGSSSVQDNQFERLQNFVIDIIQELDIGENKTRVGALLFNEQPLIQFHLNEYFSTDELIDAVLIREMCQGHKQVRKSEPLDLT